MFNIDKSDLKYLDNLFIPGFLKVKLLDKIGIDNIIYNYEEIASRFKIYDKRYLLLLLVIYRRRELKEFFKNFDCTDTSNFDLLIKLISSDYSLANLILKVIDIKVIDKIISNSIYNNVAIERLYKIRSDAYSLITNAIKSNNYQKYVNYDTPIHIKKTIISLIDIDSLIQDILADENPHLTDAIIKYRKQDVLNYISTNINNTMDILNFLKFRLPKSAYEILLNKLNINNDVISYIYSDCQDKVKEILYLKYQTEVENWLDYLIKNNSYLDAIKYEQTNIISYVITKLSINQVNELLYDKRITYYDELKKIFYQDRKNDIINIINENIKKDSFKIIDYFSLDIPEDIINIVLSNITIDENLLNKILMCGNEQAIENIFKKYKDKILSLINRNNFLDERDYLDEYLLTCKYPVVLQKELLKTLTDDEIIYIISSDKYTIRLEKYLSELYEDRIINIYNNLLKKDLRKCIKIFNTSIGTNFRKHLVDTLDFNFLYLMIDKLSSNERDKLYERFPNELIKKLREEHDNDVLSFFKNRIFASYDAIKNISISILTHDDIIKILSSGISYNAYIYNDKALKRILENAVKSKASFIRNLPYPDCLTFLKGLREGFDFLFIVFLENINLDDEFLHTLFIERGLSDKQKEILFNMKKADIKRIVKEKIESKSIDPIEYVQKGTPDEILDYALSFIDKTRLIELINNPDFIKRRSIGRKFAVKLIIRTYVSSSEKALVEELAKCYHGDTFNLIKNFEKIQDFLRLNNIDISKFWQYNLNTRYNFIDDIVNIYDKELELFLMVKNKIFNNIYDNDNKYSSKNFLDLVNNYTRYKELCLSFLEIDNINLIDFKNIKLLFNQSEVIYGINSYKDCSNIISIIKNKYINMASICSSLDDYKELIFKILFNSSKNTVVEWLANYGMVSDLLLLKYYNLDNPLVLESIDKVIGYTNELESILNCQDKDSLVELLDGILKRIDLILTDFSLVNYSELMRELYAVEMDLNLSKVGSNVLEDKVKLEDKSREYGVDIYDFRDKQYNLLAHVISESENIDDLILGKSNGKHNFISMSAISHRMQAFYYNARNMILGYDNMPHDNFICSSINNMGSNGLVKNNSSEVLEVSRRQRGVLELSDTSTNSEILAIREGIKPKYIISPGRYPTREEIIVAKKYNLKIILTQQIDKSIKSPKKIKEDRESSYEKETLIKFKNELINLQNKERKIAILTDPHGLLEPTITALEDIRKRGITEIYSLGDNIGTGSEPKSVINILEQYGVKSIKGNHELYLIRGVDCYKRHLDMTNAYDETLNNVNWTSSQISEYEKEIISNYNDYLELDINGKKVLLCHFLYDYNSGKPLFDVSKYDLVIQGHRHFYQENGKVITLKALGMGNLKKKDVGNATYMILSFKDNELSYEFINIPYAYLNTINANNVSSNTSKEKIISWIGRK